MPFTLMSWNVNSVRKRLAAVEALCQAHTVDVLCLQETRVSNKAFPVGALTDLGFDHMALAGSGGRSGVAILSRRPLVDAAVHDWLGTGDGRHVSGSVETATGLLRVHSVYVPSGAGAANPETNPKFAAKIRFLEGLGGFLNNEARSGGRSLVCGDFNIAPTPEDVWDHLRLKSTVGHTARERRLMDEMRRAGRWTDAVRRCLGPETRAFSWWRYSGQGPATAKTGWRLDHLWASEGLTPLLSDARILSHVRDWCEPSDHAPIKATFELEW